VLYGFFGVVLFGGVGAAVEGWLLELVGGSWALALPPFVLALLLAWIAVHLPLESYRELVILRQEGLSTTTWRTWIGDQLKGLLVGLVLTTALAYPVVALVRHLPTLWPLPAAAAVLGVSAFAIWISPWVIAPLFNRFWPLEDEQLAVQVRELATRAGLAVQRVLVTDASRRSTTLNAYFTGLGNSRRVVLYDTLVQACGPEEILSVVGHELGHWRRHHIAKLFALETVGVTGGLWALQLLLDSAAFRGLLGLPAPSSLVLLAALPFLATLGGRVFAPVGAAISRRFERQADRAAFELTADPQAFIRLEQLLVRRAKADLLQPTLVHRLYGSHPLPEERIRAAASHQPTPAGTAPKVDL
jgi:STE24 endopeptidase